jgi:hypothetical protein
VITTDTIIATEAAMASRAEPKPTYQPGHNSLESWERDILNRGEELLSAFASEEEMKAWAEKHGLLETDFRNEYLKAARAQRLARKPRRQFGRTGIR